MSVYDGRTVRKSAPPTAARPDRGTLRLYGYSTHTKLRLHAAEVSRIIAAGESLVFTIVLRKRQWRSEGKCEACGDRVEAGGKRGLGVGVGVLWVLWV